MSALRVIAASLVFVSATGCWSGCAGVGSSGARCDRCSEDEICALDSGGAEIGCTPLCGDGYPDCQIGHLCIELSIEPSDGGVGGAGGVGGSPGSLLACDPICDDALCPPQQACRGTEFAQCVPVPCSEEVACADPAELCDPSRRECYPFSGRCASVDDCPGFRIESSVERDCLEGFCRILSRSRSLPSPLSEISGPVPMTRPLIDVTKPEPGDVFENEDMIEFLWSGQPAGGVVLLVVTEPPTDIDTMRQTAIWVAGVASNSASEAKWEHGVGRQDGAWLDRPLPAPTDTPLYLAIISFEGDEVRAVSQAIPFQVGAGTWPRVGDRCTDEGELSGQCEAPGAPMVCQGSRCRVLCLSDVDCVELLPDCGSVIGGVRTCR